MSSYTRTQDMPVSEEVKALVDTGGRFTILGAPPRDFAVGSKASSLTGRVPIVTFGVKRQDDLATSPGFPVGMEAAGCSSAMPRPVPSPCAT